jgi:undecaprenyl-diphosphatase
LKEFETIILRLFDWLGRNELMTLVLVASAAAGIWAFAELADEVVEGETHVLDRTVLLALRDRQDPTEPLGPRWFEDMMRDITAFGGITWVVLFTLSTLGYLALQRQMRAVAFVAVAITGGWILSWSLKWLFSRSRPDLVPHGSYVVSASFPSGHSLMAAATYLTLAGLLARVQPQRRLKAYLLFLAILLTLATGVSRVYLGVHWPTDVLAGWTLGGTWAVICWIAARWLQQRGHLEGQEP